jgi:hypothetical protein
MIYNENFDNGFDDFIELLKKNVDKGVVDEGVLNLIK